MTKKGKNIQDSEYGVDFRYQSEEEQALNAAALLHARLKRMKDLPEREIIRAKLLQLKFKMEDFLKRPVYDNSNHFLQFLETYIDIIYSKRVSFARDIDITPVRLSQIINKHRNPQDEFIMKLMIHSEIVYNNICEFQKKTWYQVYYHEKICDTMSNQEMWRPRIEKQVQLSEPFKKYGKK